MVAPSRVPTVNAPFIMNFMLLVPLASYPAVEICSDTSAAGINRSGERHVVLRKEQHLDLLAYGRVGIDYRGDAC